MSTYSTNLALELIGTGEQAGTWGNTTNTNLGTLIEQAISGYVTQAVSTGTDTTITIPNGATGVARNMFIELTGTGGTNTNLIVPANKKLYFIYNNASGAVTVKVSGQTGVSVAAGAKVILVSNGTDIVTATSYSTIGSSLNLTTLTANSATITNLNSTSATITNLLGTTLTISGNVGVGTTSPESKLAVKGSSGDADLFSISDTTVPTSGTEYGVAMIKSNSTDYMLNITSYNATGKGLRVYHNGGTAASYAFLVSTFSADRFVIDGVGNVGIGTNSPSAKLDVFGGDIRSISGVISDIAGNVRNVPSAGTTKTSAYTLAITDIGEFVTVGTSGSIVVPNDVFAAGNAVSLYNDTTGNVTVSLTITTAYIAGTNTDKASVTLATRGLATILFVNPSLCVVTGNVS